jgi:hypothetical protein
MMNRIFVVVALLVCGTVAMADQNSATDHCASYDVEGTCPATKVSFAELLRNPSEYHGKRIETIGFLYLEFEHMALYGQRKTNNGIWVNIDHFPLETEADWERSAKHYRLWRCKYSKHWVIVRGLYDMHPTGHMAPTHQGSIELERLQLRSGQEKACRN